MAEGKKRLFKRSTVERTYNELVERVSKVSKLDLLMDIKDIIVFGSFVNTNNEKIHDLDVCLVGEPSLKYSSSELLKISQDRIEEKGISLSFFDTCYYYLLEAARYIQNGSIIISLHGNYGRKIVTSDKHIFLMKDGKVLDEPLVCEGTKYKE